MSNADLGIRIRAAGLIESIRNLTQLRTSAGQVESAVNSMSDMAVRAFNRMNGAIDGSLRATTTLFGSMRRFGSGTLQNVSWQVGDFATQLGSGTAASVALGQQLPQVLSSFGAIGAAAGAAAAIIIPLTAGFLNFEKEVEDTGKVLDRLSDASSRAQAALDDQRSSVEQLRDKYGEVDEKLGKFIDTQARLAMDEAKRNIIEMTQLFSEFGDMASQQNRSDLPGLAGGAFAGIASILPQINQGTVALQENLNTTLPVAQALNAAFAEYSKSLTAQDLISNLQRIQDVIETTRDESGNLPPEMLAFAQEILNAENTARGLLGVVASISPELFAARTAAAELGNELARAAANKREFHRAETEAINERNERGDKLFTDRIGRALDEEAAENQRQIEGFTNKIDGTLTSLEERDKYINSISAKLNDLDSAAAKKTAKATGGGGGGMSDEQRDLERLIETRKRLITGLEFELSLVGQTDVARRIANETRRAEVDINSELGQKIADYVIQIEAAELELERLDAVNAFATDSAVGLFEAMSQGADSASEYVRNLIGELGRMALTTGFQNLFAGSGLGQSAIGMGLSSIFGLGMPVRGTGGPAYAGQPLIVGDMGRPEVFVPGQNGTILPKIPQTSQGAASGRVTVEVTSYFDDNGNFESKVKSVSRSEAVTVVAQAEKENSRTFNQRARHANMFPRR